MARRFRAHETFYIRKGWLSKGLKYVNMKSDVFTARDENPMDILGIGSNMVKSLRYWMQAVGLTNEIVSKKRYQQFTPFGELVWKHDRYIEETGTLQLLHYNLVRDSELAPSWNFFFNKFPLSEFSREEYLEFIGKDLKASDETVALRSLTDDFNCMISTYLPKYKTESKPISPESNLICPLTDLGLLDVSYKHRGQMRYRKTPVSVHELDPWIVLAILTDQSEGEREIPISKILNQENNLGKLFNLDSIDLLNVLYNTEKTEKIKLIRTAGLDVVEIDPELTFIDCVNRYYSLLED